MKRYSRYKDTNIEWIGEIPEHWEIKPLKYVAKYEKGKNAAKFTKEFCSQNNGEYHVYSGQTQDEGILGLINQADYDIEKGILVTTVGAKAMSTKIVSGKFSLSQNCALIQKRTSGFNIKYLYYQLGRVFNYEKDLLANIMQPSLRFEDLDKYRIVFPPSSEQIQISSYLDNKTSLIDKLINNNNTLIKLLEEKRTALINKVVTKGLDPNVKMKDSGIEWIGEIPEHWEIKKLKYLLAKNDSGVWGKEPKNIVGERVLRSTEIGVNGELVNMESAVRRHLSDREKMKAQLQKGDLLVTKSSGSKKHIGKTALMDSKVESEPTYCSNFMQLLRPGKQLSPNYAHLFLNSDITRYQYNLLANTTTGLANLNSTHFDNLIIPNPPLSEQTRISSYLDTKTSLIDKAIKEVKTENTLLKEYRQSLISNIVTGKIDVRNN
jgi:type I restriction enzyme S subunit